MRCASWANTCSYPAEWLPDIFYLRPGVKFEAYDSKAAEAIKDASLR
jgi:hypothetical protein